MGAWIVGGDGRVDDGGFEDGAGYEIFVGVVRH